MSEIQDSWKEVASKAEALGLKLKLHLEQEQDEASEREPGDTKAMIDDLGQRLSDAFEGVGNAAKDPAVHEDVKDIGSVLKNALLTTLNTVGAEVQSRAPGSSGDEDSPQDAVADVVDSDSGSGDESDDGDA